MHLLPQSLGLNDGGSAQSRSAVDLNRIAASRRPDSFRLVRTEDKGVVPESLQLGECGLFCRCRDSGSEVRSRCALDHRLNRCKGQRFLRTQLIFEYVDSLQASTGHEIASVTVLAAFAAVFDNDASIVIKPEIETELHTVGAVCSPWLTFVGINIQIELEKIG